MKTVIIPTDFSLISKAVVDSGLAFLAKREDVQKVILLNTYALPISNPSQLVAIHDELKKRSLQGLEEELARIKKNHAMNGVVFETQSYLGALENVLSYLVREGGIDCVVLGLGHGKNAGDETLRVLQRLTCPALVLPGNRP